jgi:hypothetical protein
MPRKAGNLTGAERRSGVHQPAPASSASIKILLAGKLPGGSRCAERGQHAALVGKLSAESRGVFFCGGPAHSGQQQNYPAQAAMMGRSGGSEPAQVRCRGGRSMSGLRYIGLTSLRSKMLYGSWPRSTRVGRASAVAAP